MELPTLADCTKYGMKPDTWKEGDYYTRSDGDVRYAVYPPHEGWSEWTTYRNGVGFPLDHTHPDWESAFKAVSDDIVSRAVDQALAPIEPFKSEGITEKRELVLHKPVFEVTPMTVEEYQAEMDKPDFYDMRYEIEVQKRVEEAIVTLEDYVYETKVRKDVKDTFEAFVKAYSKKEEPSETEKAIHRVMSL